MPERETPDPEIKLIDLTAPRLPDGRPDGLGALALRNGLTRRQTAQLLAGETPDPRTPDHCPMAGECPTVCGEAQRREIIKFPPTESGGYEECGYYRFLAIHGRSRSGEGGRSGAERIVSATKRARNEREPEEYPEEEPEDGGEAEGRSERRTAKKERKVKRPAGGQTMLGF